MNPHQNTFAPAALITKIIVGGFVLAGGALLLLSRPGDAPTPPAQVVFQQADGCFYEQTTQPQALKRIDRPCVTKQELAAFKAGKTGLPLAGQLDRDAQAYSQQQRVYLTELAQSNEEKNSSFAALSRRVKPVFDFLDKLSPFRLFSLT
jgi:hypothetical protein